TTATPYLCNPIQYGATLVTQSLTKYLTGNGTVTGGMVVASVGPSLQITPFDEFGRRIYEMQTVNGPLAVVQGISELTARYAKVEALRGSDPREVMWDMRMATSSIPRETLAKILAKKVARDDPEARLQVVRFYIQAERFHDARRELEQIVRDFPDKANLKNEVSQLRQMGARRVLQEIELRSDAGQHRLVGYLLKNFPAEDVAGETLAQVRQQIAQHEAREKRIDRTAEQLQKVIAEIADPNDRGLAAPIADEIVREMSHGTVNRLAPFVQLLDDATLSAEAKTALAISGWLLGAEAADERLPVAISLVRVRDGVRNYLREPGALERAGLLTQLRSLEGASVEKVAEMIARMKPVWHDPQLVAAEFGSHELMAPGSTEDGDFRYLVQLPAEYDPYRPYPTIVALNGAYNGPEQELDFWAGSPSRDETGAATSARNGQAMRHGYITIAVDWLKPHQYEYEFSAREHVAVTTCLRDAMRRFHVDADRIYLTGHGIGGQATWDIAQAHPDIWAGAIPFVALAGDSYIRHYWENAQYVPLYLVSGELDGHSMSKNAALLDKYLRSTSRPVDATVVEYQGRGHEPFHDEVLRVFDWMSKRTRSGPPDEFECTSLRPWDNYFWWIECEEFPEKQMVYPVEWEARRATPAKVTGKRPIPNRLTARTSAARVTLWLNPDVVDFSKPIRIEYGRRKLKEPQGGLRPDLEVLLEDVRTRADRKRPFWAKVSWP
ncbi:MAG: PLP-dependent transferase, partial [Planctomycetota bacterium]